MKVWLMGLYAISNNKAMINGKKGDYVKEVKDAKIRYGQNASNNYVNGYVKSLAPGLNMPLVKDAFQNKSAGEIEANANIVADYAESDKMPPINFKFRYSPVKFFKFSSPVHKMALMGAAYEELGKRKSAPKEEIAELLKALHGEEAKATADAFDLNKDGQIDVSEEAASIVLTDMLSAKKYNAYDYKKANGKTNNLGEKRLQAFALEENKEMAGKVLNNIHEGLKLDEAQAKFFEKV